MKRLVAAPDPYRMAPLANQPISAGRAQVSSIVNAGDFFYVAEGQSNIANFHRGSYSAAQSGNHCFDNLNGGIYQSQNPMLGCNGWGPGSGDDSNMLVRLNDKLIASGFCSRAIAAPIARGGTSSYDWAYGVCKERVEVMAAWIRLHRIPVKAILRDQGETDATNSYDATTVAGYHRAWAQVWRDNGVTCPIFIAKVSISTSIALGSPASDAVRLGQANALSNPLGIYAGPDCDQIGHRYDGVHHDATGSDLRAAAWQSVIEAFF